jgi:hypothetical protein
MRKSRSREPKARRHDHGSRRACAGGGRDRRRRSPIAPMSDRRAAASRRSSRPTTVRPRSCRRRPTASPKCRTAWRRRRRRENRAARRSAGRRQSKSGPRVVFPPLNQNGNPPPRRAWRTAGIAAGAPRNGTLPNNEPRKIKTLPVKGDASRWRRVPVTSPPARRENRPAARAAAAHAAPVLPAQPAIIANASANAPLSLVAAGRASPQPIRAPTRVLRQPGPAAPAAAAAADIWFRSPRSERGRRPGLLPGAAGQVPGGAGIACAADQARRSRRQGRLLPRHGRPVRLRPKKRRSSAAT